MSTASTLTGRDLPRIVTSLPGPRSRAIAETSIRTEPYSLTRLRRESPPIYWAAGHGANVMDVDGNVFIDCSSAFGVAAVGHGSPEVAEAIADQAHQLVHCGGDVFPNPHRPLLSEMILELAGELGSMQVAYGNLGAEAVEIGLKAALAFTRRPGVIAFHKGFHGQTLGALSVVGFPELRTPFRPYLSPHTRFLPYPDPYRRPGSGPQILAEIERLVRQSRGTESEIGVVLIEPVQGCAGSVFPEEGFLPGLQQLCRTHGVLLFCDEILTGLGRTGYWLASHAEGIRPDIITLGKILGGGMAIGACLARPEILQALDCSYFLTLHGSTFGGDPLACRAALAALAVVRELSLAEINRKGALIQNAFHELQRKHALIGHVRGRGLMNAVELVRDRSTREPPAIQTIVQLVTEALSRGVILLPIGIPEGNVIVLAPPFPITDEQIRYCIDTLDHALGVASGKSPRSNPVVSA